MFDELFKSLSTQGGLLGTLLAISLLANGTTGALLVKVVKMLLLEKDKRTDDAVKYRDDIVQPIQKVGSSMEELTNQIKISNQVRMQDRDKF